MKNVPIPLQLRKLIASMPREDVGILLVRILDYAADEPEESSSPLAEGVFSLVRPTIDRAMAASERHRESGKSGGRPKKKQPASPKATAEPTEKKETLEDIVNAYTQNKQLHDALMSFAESRKQQRKPMTLNAVRLQLKELDKLSQTDDGKIAIVEQSVARGWLSFYALKQERGPNGVQIKPEPERLHDLDDIFGIGG